MWARCLYDCAPDWIADSKRPPRVGGRLRARERFACGERSWEGATCERQVNTTWKEWMGSTRAMPRKKLQHPGSCARWIGKEVRSPPKRPTGARSCLQARGGALYSEAGTLVRSGAFPCLPMEIHYRNARASLEYEQAAASATRFAVSPTELCVPSR